MTEATGRGFTQGGAGEYPLSEIETRSVVLGHIQRGGSPSAFDRVLATRYGLGAIDMVHRGEFGQMAALRGNKIVSIPLAEAIATFMRGSRNPSALTNPADAIDFLDHRQRNHDVVLLELVMQLASCRMTLVSKMRSWVRGDEAWNERSLRSAKSKRREL
jgi:6-phosphofructokinase